MADAAALPGLEHLNGLVRSVTTPEFAGMTFHEVMCKSALNHVPGASAMPFDWTVNPYRGCSHACVLLLRPRNARVPRPRRGARLRLADRREDQRRRGAREGARARQLAATIPSCSAPTPTRTSAPKDATGSCPTSSAALTDSGTPFSILTKGTLLRRDLPLLQEAAASVECRIAMSIAVFDDALQHSRRAGHAVRRGAARDRAGGDRGRLPGHGVPDADPAAPDRLDRRRSTTPCERIKDAGADRVVFGALHLRPGAKQWFMQWLAREHPELVSSYLGLYPGAAAKAPKAYRSWLAKRVRPLLRVHGLDGHAEDDANRPRSAGVPGLALRSQIITTSRGRASRAADGPAMLF